MKRIELKKGLDVPITGDPKQEISPLVPATRVALLGDDYIGMKPTMEVSEGDHVKTGQLLFRDKKNEGVIFTAPATGKIASIDRGAKRKFESLVIECEDDDFVSFLSTEETKSADFSPEKIRETLIASSLWTAFRTRPFGKVPPIDSSPAALFITVIDTRPLAGDPTVIIADKEGEFIRGLQILESFVESPVFLCTEKSEFFLAWR